MARKLIAIVGETAPDRILDAWKKNSLDKLSEDDQKILKRITEVEKRFHEKKLVKDAEGKDTDYGARPWKWKDLVEYLVEAFKISHRQAYADIELAKDFFLLGRGRNDIEFARGYRINQGEEMMYQCMDAKDYRAASAFFKEIVKLDVLDRKEDNGVDPSQFQPVRLEIVTDPVELGFPKMANPDQVVDKLLKSFRKSIVEKMVDDSEEVSPEE